MSMIKDFRSALKALAALGDQRSSLESPDIPLSSAEVLQYIGGSPASSGVSVSEDSAMSTSSVLAGVRVLSESVAGLSLETYRVLSGGGRSRAYGHPVYDLLKNRPNPFMTSFVYREMAMQQLIFHGNHYAEIEYGANGYPVALWPLDPRKTRGVVSGRDSLTYITEINGQRIGLPAYRVLHIPFLSGDGINGRGIIAMARETIGMAIAQDRYNGTFFSNGAHPGGFLSHPNRLTPEARRRIAAAWYDANGGLSNAHRTAVLEEGITWNRTSVSPEEAQLIDTRKFTRSEIAGILRVPAHFINDLERATFSNIEHLSIDFVRHSLRPWLIRWEQEINVKMFSGERPYVYVEFNVDSILRGDKKSRAEALEIERRNGIISANEWRRLENQNPISSDYGDSYMVQMSNALISPNGDFTALNVKPSDGQRALQIIMDDALSRIARREERELLRLSKKSEALQGDEQWRAIVHDFYDHADWIDEALDPVRRAGAAMGIDVELSGYKQRSIELLEENGLDDWSIRRFGLEGEELNGET